MLFSCRMAKHLYSLPAVVAVFMELDWKESNFNEKKIECASRVQSVRCEDARLLRLHSPDLKSSSSSRRSTLLGRSTKLAVVLVQRDGGAPGLQSAEEDALAAERASALCSACELSNRSLFVLPHPEGNGARDGGNLNGFVVKLENALYEMAQNYYHQVGPH